VWSALQKCEVISGTGTCRWGNGGCAGLFVLFCNKEMWLCIQRMTGHSGGQGRLVAPLPQRVYALGTVGLEHSFLHVWSSCKAEVVAL
jgi:hypothetical protein